MWLLPLNDQGHVLMTLYGSSALGQVYQVVAVVMTFFGLLVPFLAADGVARDHRQRTHELVMTTAIPGWTLVAGRFYTTQWGTGSAVTATGVLRWNTSGLTGPSDVNGGPDAAVVVTAPPDPTAPTGTLATTYLLYAYNAKNPATAATTAAKPQ